jgi:hypothetical protein
VIEISDKGMGMETQNKTKFSKNSSEKKPEIFTM